MLAIYKYIFPCVFAVLLYKILTRLKMAVPESVDPPQKGGSRMSEKAGSTVPNPEPLPAYFVSHGGPTFMYKDDDFGNAGAYTCLQELGRRVTHELKPDYILMVSAHWQSNGSKAVDIAVPPAGAELAENSLIYDFYGFPDYMYQEKFRSQNSRFVSQQVQQQLQKNGFSSRLVERGIDHGVWVPASVMFAAPKTQAQSRAGPMHSGKLDLDIPLVQVSLTAEEADFDTHYRLGQVLSHFRENLIFSHQQNRPLKGLVICSGMSVHNLRDLGAAMRTGTPMTYAKKFNSAILSALEKPNLLQAFNELKASEPALMKQAHPTLEHFVPLVVAGGSAPNANVKELYNDEQLSLGWGVYEFTTRGTQR